MEIFCIVFFFSVETRFGRNINFTADNRFDAAFLSRLVKINDAVHGAVVGYRQRCHAEIFCRVEQVINSCRAVEQTVFRMNVQMSEIHEASSPPEIFFLRLIRVCW